MSVVFDIFMFTANALYSVCSLVSVEPLSYVSIFCKPEVVLPCTLILLSYNIFLVQFIIVSRNEAIIRPC